MTADSMQDGTGAEWWRRPFRMVQTNLRMTDAALDPATLADETVALGCSVLLFNIGGIYAFYPTELELQARNWFLENDLLGEMIEAAHDQGLKLVGRFDMSKATRIAYEAHPEWFVHNRAGKPLEYNGTYQACVNGGWYNGYAHRIIEEALGKYPVDGVFFNMFGYRSTDYSGNYHGICTCANCRSRFGEMYGRELPEREDFADPSYRDYLLFQDRTSLELADGIYTTIKRVRPETAVMGQRTTCDLIRMEIQRAVDRPAPEWPHQAGEQAKWAGAFGKGKVYSSTSANFIDFAWRFVAETGACHLLRFAQQIGNGATLDYYLLGVIDQDDKKPMGDVRGLFNWYAEHDAHYAGVRSTATTGLYHSRKTNVFGRAADSAAYIQSAFRGAYRALLDARTPFDFVIDEQAGEPGFADTLDRYDTIVLPDIACLEAGEAGELDRFVERGGTLIATGETGLYDEVGRRRDACALRCLPVARHHGLRPDMRGAYFRQPAGDTRLVADTGLLYLDGPYWMTEPEPEAERLLTLLPPQRFGPPEQCFPDVESDHPGVLVGRHGKGTAILLPWLPDWLYQRDSIPDFRDLLVGLARRYGGEPPVKLEGAGHLELTIGAESGSGARLVHVINYAGQRNNLYEPPTVAHGLRLGLRDAAGLAATALRSGTELTFSEADADGYAWASLPPVGAFEAIAIRP